MLTLSRLFRLCWGRGKGDDNVTAVKIASAERNRGNDDARGEITEDRDLNAAPERRSGNTDALTTATDLDQVEAEDIGIMGLLLGDPNAEDVCLPASFHGDFHQRYDRRFQKQIRYTRPVTEPPIFNYDQFERECIPSDKMLRKTFPGNPEKATAYRDVLTEVELLGMFSDWARDMRRGLYLWCPGRSFYYGLEGQLCAEHHELKAEHERFTATLTDLESWQTRFLDKDGNMEGIGAKLKVGENIFTDHQGGELALAKYSFLLDELPRRPTNDLATWESFWLDNNGQLNSKVKQTFRIGADKDARVHSPELDSLFTSKYFGGKQAREQHFHLCWEAWNLDEDGGTIELRGRILKGENVFRGEDGQAALKKWRYLLGILAFEPRDDVKTWERFWLDSGRSRTFRLYAALRRDSWGEVTATPFDHRYYGGKEAEHKYGYVLWETWLLLGFRPQRTIPTKPITSSENVSTYRRGRKYANSGPCHLWLYPSWPPRDDIDTWEYFHLEQIIDATESQTKIPEYERSNPLNSRHYGGTAARKKYSYLVESEYDETRGEVTEVKEEDADLQDIPPADILRVTIQNLMMRQAFSGRLSLGLRPEPAEDDTDSPVTPHEHTPNSFISYVWDRTLLNARDDRKHDKDRRQRYQERFGGW